MFTLVDDCQLTNLIRYVQRKKRCPTKRKEREKKQAGLNPSLRQLPLTNSPPSGGKKPYPISPQTLFLFTKRCVSCSCPHYSLRMCHNHYQWVLRLLFGLFAIIIPIMREKNMLPYQGVTWKKYLHPAQRITQISYDCLNCW